MQNSAISKWTKLPWVQTGADEFCLELFDNRSVQIVKGQSGQYEVYVQQSRAGQRHATTNDLCGAIKVAEENYVNHREVLWLVDPARQASPPSRRQAQYMYRLDAELRRAHPTFLEFWKFANASHRAGSHLYSRGEVARMIDAHRTAGARMWRGPIGDDPPRIVKSHGEEAEEAERTASEIEFEMRNIEAGIAAAKRAEAELMEVRRALNSRHWTARLLASQDLQKKARELEAASNAGTLQRRHLELSGSLAMWRERAAEHRRHERGETRQVTAKLKRESRAAEKEAATRVRREQERAMLARAAQKDRDLAAATKHKIRAGDCCPYCGERLGDQRHLDHIYPLSLGGLSIEPNMVWVCVPCNLRKSNQTLNQFIDANNLDRDRIYAVLRAMKKRY
jgi:5-methylcytosine-specific restriction endonuclease McrA